MYLRRIALLLSLTAASLSAHSASMLQSAIARYPKTRVTYHTILKGIEDANTEQQLFCQLKALDNIEVDKLSNPFRLLVQLSKTPSLRKASLPIKTYYTYQLYALCIKIFYAQSEKKQYITASEKKEVIENLNLFCNEQNTATNSEIINNVACVIAFIKALPQNELSRRNVETLHQLIAILLNKKSTTKKELELILQTQLKIEHAHMATYLILLELLKVHYVQKADQQAFVMLTTLFDTPELPTIVQYRMQQILGEILRTLIDKGKQYEAYYYMDQLLPFMPKLLLPLANPNPLDDIENSLLAQGLLIEWCLISPYLYVLFDMKNSSYEELEAKIQEKINEKELQEWFPNFKSQLQELGLFTQPQGQPNTLQAILAHMAYFQAINFMLVEDRQNFCSEEETPKKKTTTPSTQSKKEDSAAIKVLNESIEKLNIQTQALYEELKKIQKTQQAQQKTLQAIKKNTKAPQIKENKELLSDYPWLHPPYIWLITAGLILLLIMLLGLFIRSVRNRKRH